MTEIKILFFRIYWWWNGSWWSERWWNVPPGSKVWPALFESLRWQLCRMLLRQLFFVSFNYYCRHSHRYCQCYSHYCHHHYYYCHYFCCAKKVHIMKLWKPWAFWFDTVRSIMYWPITKKIRIICYWWRSGFLTPYKSGLFRWNTIPFHRNFRCSWFLRHLLEI